MISVARWQHPVNSVYKTHGTLISSQVSQEIRSSPAASSPARTSAPPTPAALELSASLEMTGTLIRLYVVVDSIVGIAVFGIYIINMINGYTNSHQRLKLENKSWTHTCSQTLHLFLFIISLRIDGFIIIICQICLIKLISISLLDDMNTLY